MKATKYLICDADAGMLAHGLTLEQAQAMAETLADRTVDTVYIVAYGPDKAMIECEPDLERAIASGEAEA